MVKALSFTGSGFPQYSDVEKPCAVSYTERNATNAAAGYALGDGVDWWMAGQHYLNDYDKTGIDSCLNDLGQDGVVPYGAITPQHFGAVLDNSTDNTAAINAAAVYVRTVAAANFQGNAATTNPHNEHGVCLYFPKGLYKATGEVWLGSSGDYDDGVKNITADPGAVIISHNTGGIAVNWAGVFGGRWTGLTVWGDKTNTPDVGLFCGRVGTAEPNPSAGAHHFYNAQIMGNYEVSAYYNYGSEINHWHGGRINNAKGYCAALFTCNNGNEAITSPNCTIDTTYQSCYADKFFGTLILWDGTGSTRGQGAGVADGGACVVVESVSYGPKFFGCYMDMLQGSGFTEMPYFRFKVALGETGTSSRTQGPVIDGVTFENQYHCIAYVDHRVDGLQINRCDFATGAIAEDVVVTATGDLYGADIQPHRGGTLLEWTTWGVDAAATVAERRREVFEVDNQTAYHETESTMTLDSTWREIDLATDLGISPETAWVDVKVEVRTGTVSNADYFALRADGETSGGLTMYAAPQVVGQSLFLESKVRVIGGKIQYYGSSNLTRARVLFRSFAT